MPKKAKAKTTTAPDLLRLAVSMYGEKFTDGNGDERREMLADARWCCDLAEEVLNAGRRGGKEEDDVAEQAIKAATHSEETNAGRAPSGSVVGEGPVRPRYSFEEAARALGYTGETRLERSLMALMERLEKSSPDRFSSLRTRSGKRGLKGWVEEFGFVDGPTFAQLRAFKFPRQAPKNPESAVNPPR